MFGKWFPGFAEFNDFFMVAVILIALVISVTAIIEYLSERLMTRLQRRYEEHLANQVLNKVSIIDARLFAIAPWPVDSHSIMRMTNAQSRFTAIAQRLLLRCAVPIFAAAVASIFFIFYDWTIAWPLLLFCFIAAIPFRYINMKAIDISRRFEATAENAARKKGALIRDISSNALDVREQEARQTIYHGANADFLDLYESRLNVANQSSLVSAVLASIILSALLVQFSYRVSAGHAAWSDLILLVLVMHFAFRAIQRIISLITSVNRFHKQMETIHGLVNWRPSATAKNGQGLALPTMVECPEVELGESRFKLGAGCRRFLIAPNPPGRFEIYNFLKAGGISAHQSFSSVDEPEVVLLGGTLRGNGSNQCGQAVTDSEVARLASELPDKYSMSDLGNACAKAIKGADDEVRCFLRDILVLALRQPKFMFLDQRGLLKFPRPFVEIALDLFPQSDVTIYAARQVNVRNVWNVPVFVAFNGVSVVGVLDGEAFQLSATNLFELVQSKPGGVEDDLQSDLIDVM